VTTSPMTDQDIMDACDILFKRFGKTSMVAQAIGISERFVKRYVKYARLPDSIKEAVDKGQLGDPTKAISVALKATDALQYEPEGTVPEEKVLALSKILAKKIPKEQNDIVSEAKKDPEKDLKDIVQIASAPRKSKGKSLEIIMDDTDYSRLENYQEKNKKGSPEDAALEILADGLEKAGF
jgi:hypothetical protein